MSNPIAPPPCSRADLLEGDTWYAHLRNPRFVRPTIQMPKPQLHFASGGTINGFGKAQTHQRLGDLDALLRLPDVDIHALADAYCLTVKQLLAYAEAIQGGALPPVVGQWARGGTITLNDHLVLPGIQIQPHILYARIERDAPEWIAQTLTRIRLAPRRGAGSLPSSLLVWKGDKPYLTDPVARAEALLVACLWLRDYLTSTEAQ